MCRETLNNKRTYCGNDAQPYLSNDRALMEVGSVPVKPLALRSSNCSVDNALMTAGMRPVRLFPDTSRALGGSVQDMEVVVDTIGAQHAVEDKLC